MFFMIFSCKNQIYELLQEEKGRRSGLFSLLKVVEHSWSRYNDFLDDNLKLWLKTSRDLDLLIRSAKEQLNIKDSFGEFSVINRKPSKKAFKNQVIIDEFDVNELMDKLFEEEDEVIDKNVIFTAAKNDEGLQKEEVRIEAPKIQTQTQKDRTEMRGIVKKVKKGETEEEKDREVKYQMHDLLKNINQSYSILKNQITLEKRKDNEDTKDQISQDAPEGGLHLFKKIRVRKNVKPVARKQNQNISIIKPEEPNKFEEASSMIAKPKGRSVDRLRLHLAQKKQNESSYTGLESETRLGQLSHIRSGVLRSASQGRNRSREILAGTSQFRRHGSINTRARRLKAEDSDYSNASMEVRKPKDFSEILFGDRYGSVMSRTGYGYDFN